MLRDDAIRRGLILPSKADIERMNLIPEEIREINKLNKQHKEAEAKKAGDGNN